MFNIVFVPKHTIGDVDEMFNQLKGLMTTASTGQKGPGRQEMPAQGKTLVKPAMA